MRVALQERMHWIGLASEWIRHLRLIALPVRTYWRDFLVANAANVDCRVLTPHSLEEDFGAVSRRVRMRIRNYR